MRNKAPRTYKSGVMASVHETVAGLHEAGVVDKRTMREFDRCALLQYLR